MPDMGLSFSFDVSKKTVQNIVVTWINFMHCEWSEIDIWPSKDLSMYYMPSGLKHKYPSTRVIVDGTGLLICAPKNLKFTQATCSRHENRPTLQVLVGSETPLPPPPRGKCMNILKQFVKNIQPKIYQKLFHHSFRFKVKLDRAYTVYVLILPSRSKGIQVVSLLQLPLGCFLNSHGREAPLSTVPCIHAVSAAAPA